MKHNQLLVFAISHYCEKACWALDYLGVDYQVDTQVVGLHRLAAKRLGLPKGSLPILHTVDQQVIQGSSAIIDWAEQQATNGNTLTPTQQMDELRDIEQRLDDVLGVHIRRYFYSEALIEHPDSVKAIFLLNLPKVKQFIVKRGWEKIRQVMIGGMDLGLEQGQASKVLIEQELDWLDEQLADGRSFLLGDALSRADVTAAALIAPMIKPEQHPMSQHFVMPPRISEDLVQWAERPVFAWVKRIYRLHRD